MNRPGFAGDSHPPADSQGTSQPADTYSAHSSPCEDLGLTTRAVPRSVRRGRLCFAVVCAKHADRLERLVLGDPGEHQQLVLRFVLSGGWVVKAVPRPARRAGLGTCL
jgi:hypothetical protein